MASGTGETIPAHEAIGLEQFFQMIEILKKSFPVNVRMSVLRVPPGKRFSICANGSRRTCAVVRVTYNGTTFYVVEVARPDDWSISTLILHPSVQMSFRAVEYNIKLLLNGLVRKGGHWDQSVLDQCKGMSANKLKHWIGYT